MDSLELRASVPGIGSVRLPRWSCSHSLMVALVVVGLSSSRPCEAVMPTREGTVPVAVSSAFDQGLFDLAPQGSLETSLVYPTWKVPVILADFADQPMT